jgi:DNA-binding transcriptional MerR regulator
MEANMAETEPDTYTIEQAAESLGVSPDDVRTYIDEGLVAPEPDGDGRPTLSRANMRRLWSAVTLHRDLGINLPGVAAVLRLREQYERVRRDLATLVEIVERELGPDVWDRLWPEDRPTPHANVQVESMADEPPAPGRAVSDGGADEAAAGGAAEGPSRETDAGPDDARAEGGRAEASSGTERPSDPDGGTRPSDQETDT